MEAASRRPCFIEEDDGLASLANMKAGFSCESQSPRIVFPFVSSRPPGYARSGSCRNLSSFLDSPRSVRVFDPQVEDPRPHFLEACFGCKKPLGNNKDIFMYRGDTPFCSEDCRGEQIEIDEAKERNASMVSMRKKEQKMSSSPPTAQDYSSQTGTVAAA